MTKTKIVKTPVAKSSAKTARKPRKAKTLPVEFAVEFAKTLPVITPFLESEVGYIDAAGKLQKIKVKHVSQQDLDTKLIMKHRIGRSQVRFVRSTADDGFQPVHVENGFCAIGGLSNALDMLQKLNPKLAK